MRDLYSDPRLRGDEPSPPAKLKHVLNDLRKLWGFPSFSYAANHPCPKGKRLELCNQYPQPVKTEGVSIRFHAATPSPQTRAEWFAFISVLQQMTSHVQQ